MGRITNVHRFVSFSKQVENLGGDRAKFKEQLSHVKHDQETFFSEALIKWNDKDLGSYYLDFLREIPTKEIDTYAQVLHYSDSLFNSILKHMKVPGTKSWIALLELSMALARDLKEEFYPHMWPLFQQIIVIMENAGNDVVLLDTAFLTLSLLFKQHWKMIIKELRKTFNRFCPLFGAAHHYVRRLVAEAFAVLLRKSSALPKFTRFALEKSVQCQDSKLDNGISLLIFNTFRGVNGQFHSSTNELLGDIIGCVLSEENEKLREVGISLLEGALEHTLNYAKKTTLPTVTTVLLNFLESQTSVSGFCAVLSLIAKTCERVKDKFLFTQQERLFALILQAVDSDWFKVEQNVLTLIAKFMVEVFNNEKWNMSLKELFEKLAVSSKNSPKILLDLLESIYNISCFDVYLMPSVGSLAKSIIESSDEVLQKRVISLYALICANRRPLDGVIERGTREPFFEVSSHLAVREFIINTLKQYDATTMDHHYIAALLTIWPWIFQSKEMPKESEAVETLLCHLLAQAASSDRSQYLELSQLTLICGSALYQADKKLLKKIKETTVTKFVREYSCCDSSVRLYRLFVEVWDVRRDIDGLDEAIAILAPSFRSPFSAVRRTALEVCASFDVPLTGDSLTDDNGCSLPKAQNMFRILADAEAYKLTPNDCRERLSKLRLLMYGHHNVSLPAGRCVEYEKVILCIGLSQWYVQFTPLWPGINDLLVSYGDGMNIDDFWPAVDTFLQNSVQGIRNNIELTHSTSLTPLIGDIDPTSRTDYPSYIIQMLKFLCKVSEIAERRTKTLSPLLLDFFEKDYLHSERTPMMDARSKKINSKDFPADDNNEEDVENNDINEITENKEKQPEFILNSGKARNILVAFLELFSRVRGPKQIFRQEEVYALYMEMLLTFDEDLQGAALKCIFAYKHKWLTPYKEHFLKLVDNKTFTDSLIKFQIGGESCVLEEEHRSAVLPILLRVLYGKLITPVTRMGRHNVAMTIIRFLNNCHADEIDIFIRLALFKIENVVGSDTTYEDLAKRISDPAVRERIDLKHINITLRCIENILSGISQVLNEDQRSRIFRLLVSCIICMKELDAHIPEDDFNKKTYVKKANAHSYRLLKQYILTYSHYDWSLDMVNCLWKWTVLPYCHVVNQSDRVLTVSSHGVTLLFSAIADRPRLYDLLSCRLVVDGVAATPIRILTDVLLWEDATVTQVKLVRDAMLHLLEYADETNSVNADLVCEPMEVFESTNKGTCIVLSRMDVVMQFLAVTIERNKTKHADEEILTILISLSPYLKCPKMCYRFAASLLTLLEKKKAKNDRKEGVIAKVLKALACMVSIIDRPEDMYCHLPKLFMNMMDQATRESLGEVALGLANNKKCQEIDGELLRALFDLESWDRSRMNEPDFERRAVAFNKLLKIWRSETPSLTNMYLICAIANSCANAISTIADIALRAQSSMNVREMVEYLPKPGFDMDMVNALTDQYLIPMVIRGFRHETEAVRDDFVRILHSLVSSLSKHPRLSQLRQLRNDDVELDFFENAVNIQMVRRRFGFSNLAKELNDGAVVVDPQVLLDFLVPLIRHHMLQITEKQAMLSDAALELLGAIMAKAPWQQYISLLDNNINQLAHDIDREKAFIRVVCTILDAFHFEASEEAESDDPVSVEEIKTKERKGDEESPMEVDVFSDDEEMDDEECEEISSKREMKEPTKQIQTVSRVTVYDKVLKKLLPKLKDAINGRLNPKAKEVHKQAMDAGKKHYQEDDDLRRVPIVLAAVKLLQKLPKEALDQNLQNVMMKLVFLLIAHSDRVREAARKVMIKVVQSLGAKYLPFVIREMKQLMKRGHQVHILIFTTHTLMGIMKDELSPGDLDPCLDVVMELCCNDLFYEASEEKEILAIRAKVMEAKANRTMDTIENVGRYVGPKSLRVVLAPILEVVDRKPTAKTIKDVSELLRHMAIGIKDNSGVDPQTLLIFCHQLLNEHVTKMMDVQKKNTPKKELKAGEKPESCLIIPAAPKRLGEIQKHSLKSRSHVFVEYSLQIISFLLQNKRFDTKSEEDIGRLDPFVPFLAKCLALKYDKVTTLALRCVYNLLPFPLPSLHANTKSLTERLFVILADYSALGNAGNKQAVLQLNQLLFKTFTGLIRISPVTLLTEQHIELLLNYIETDVLDSNKQATAFHLLKTLINKEIQHARMPEVMKLISEQAVLSDYPHIQQQCRVVVANFVGQHPQSRTPRKEIEWWLAQIDYEHEPGRLSAAEMLHTLFSNMLQQVLDPLCIFATVKLGARIVNDESSKCKRFFSLALRTLLAGVGEGSRNDVFSACHDWLKGEAEGSYAVASEVIIQLSSVEESAFLPRLLPTLSLIGDVLERPNSLEELAENTILALLNCVTHVLRNSKPDQTIIQPLLHKFMGLLGRYCRCAQELESIRLASASLLGQIFSLTDAVSFGSLSDPSPFDLVDWSLFQLRAKTLSEAMAQQAIKNILFLTTVISDDQWNEVVNRSVKACQFEIRKLPDQAIRRLSLFKLCAGLVMRSEGDRLSHIAENFIPLLTREMLRKSAKNTDELFAMANEVGEVLKNRMGESEYTDVLAKCSKEINDKAFERKTAKKEKVVAEPMKAVLANQKKNKKKSELRKRKLDAHKPYRALKRKHLEEYRATLNED